MGLNALLAKLERRAADTPDTPCNPDGVSAKPAWIKACTLDTPDTPEIINAVVNVGDDLPEPQNATAHWHWLVHFADREPLEVYCNPDADFANIMQTYPDALAAEPIPERTRRTPTEAEAAELRALVQAIGKAEEWTADEIEWAMAGALADPDGALICFQDIAGGFNAAVENNDRTVNESPENRHQSGDNK